MFNKLPLRSKLFVIVAPPLAVLGLIAVSAMLLGFRGGGSAQELTNVIRMVGVAAMATFLGSVLLVVIVSRTITSPLGELTTATDELANVRLPMLVDALRDPGMETSSFPPIVIDETDDEVGHLVRGLNAVQDRATEIAAAQRTMVREGLSDLVVNLARRNQSLIDRQIENIDVLESSEEDPDRLERLFRLDHLATRMRRNAESLLVVAGAEPPRRRGGPVGIGDILRVSMSEIEDYRHVHLRSIGDAKLPPQGAVDLAHLVSELLENATQFSPPETPVEVSGARHADGSYVISVADRGLGMPPEQLEAANTLLANPPELGLTLSRSLGFIVVARLSTRLGVNVHLSPSDGSGVTAQVSIPASVMAGVNPSEVPPAAAAALAAEPSPVPTHHVQPVEPRPASEPSPAVGQSEALARLLGEQPPSHEPPAKLEQAVPTGQDFETGVAALLQQGGQSAEGQPSDTTSSGLVRRNRNASQAPPSEGRPIANERAVTASTRSPEEVRDMLARYREGRAAPPEASAGPTTQPVDGAPPQPGAQPDSQTDDPFGGQA